MRKHHPAQIQIPLDIPEVDVLSTQIRNGKLYLEVESWQKSTTCQICRNLIPCNYGKAKARKLRHLPVFGMETYIRIKPKRGQCKSCPYGPTATQELGWYDKNGSQTKMYENYLMRLLVGSTIEEVSRKEEIGYDKIVGVLKRCVNTAVNWQEIKDLQTIGIDEISMKKGHKDYVALVTVRQKDGEIKILGVLTDRKKKTVRAFLEQIPPKLHPTIENFTTDMWKGYISAITEFIADHEQVNAYLVIDRYHVAQQYRKRFDTLRKKELKRLKKSLLEETYKADCHGAIWLLRKNHANLDEKQRQQLRRLFAHSPQLHLAYTLREEVTAIFNTQLSLKQGTARLQKWMAKVRRSTCRCFDLFLKTLQNHWHGIVNYFHHRINSGFVEGLNNKVKVIKRRCFGIKHPTTLFQRLWLDLQGLAHFTL